MNLFQSMMKQNIKKSSQRDRMLKKLKERQLEKQMQAQIEQHLKAQRAAQNSNIPTKTNQLIFSPLEPK